MFILIFGAALFISAAIGETSSDRRCAKCSWLEFSVICVVTVGIGVVSEDLIDIDIDTAFECLGGGIVSVDLIDVDMDAAFACPGAGSDNDIMPELVSLTGILNDDSGLDGIGAYTGSGGGNSSWGGGIYGPSDSLLTLLLPCECSSDGTGILLWSGCCW